MIRILSIPVDIKVASYLFQWILKLSISRGKNKCQSFIYEPQYTKMCIFLSLNQNMKNIYTFFFHIWGGPGGPYVEPR